MLEGGSSSADRRISSGDAFVQAGRELDLTSYCANGEKIQK